MKKAGVILDRNCIFGDRGRTCKPRDVVVFDGGAVLEGLVVGGEGVRRVLTASRRRPKGAKFR
jgi:hypothetical protein